MGSNGGVLGSILNPVMEFLFGAQPELPEPPPLPSFPEPPPLDTSQARTAEDREAETRRRLEARRTGNNPNVLTTPLGVTEPAPVTRPKLLGR